MQAGVELKMKNSGRFRAEMLGRRRARSLQSNLPDAPSRICKRLRSGEDTTDVYLLKRAASTLTRIVGKFSAQPEDVLSSYTSSFCL
jgi:hypothetical protein